MNTKGNGQPTTRTIVKIQRMSNQSNIFRIHDQSGSRRQISYGLKLTGSKQEGLLRAGKPIYYYAEWSGIGWNLAGEAPAQDW